MVKFLDPIPPIDPVKLEKVFVECTNRHIGRILHNCGDAVPMVIKSLIKKEMWFCAENVLKEACNIDLKPRGQEPWKPSEKSGN
jgi:hypothetical protein